MNERFVDTGSWLSQLLIVALLILLFLSSGQRPAQAQDGAFQAESDATYTFGQGMTFSLRAKSDEPIEGVSLFFNTPGMDSTYTTDLAVDPAQEIALQHELALTQVQLAPFTTVRYWWRVVTPGGSFQVEEQTLDYVDDRFQWHRAVRDDVAVHWTGDDPALGQAAMDVVAGAQQRLQAIVPADAAPLSVYVYPSMADLRSALRLTGRDWVGAEAMPELGVVLVTAVNPRTAAFDLGQSIPHELSHLMLYRATEANYENVPRWFDEGLATIVEDSPDGGQDALLQQAIATQSTLPMIELCRTFPASEGEARLAYAQSASLVRYIQQEYGNRALRELVKAFADGAECDSGVRRVLDLSLEELERTWLTEQRPASLPVRFWRNYGLWVLLVAGGFAFTGLLLLPLRRE